SAMHEQKNHSPRTRGQGRRLGCEWIVLRAKRCLRQIGKKTGQGQITKPAAALLEHLAAGYAEHLCWVHCRVLKRWGACAPSRVAAAAPPTTSHTRHHPCSVSFNHSIQEPKLCRCQQGVAELLPRLLTTFRSSIRRVVSRLLRLFNEPKRPFSFLG